ncbi:MAG: sulfatase-like hydrolase/transferase [Thermomicrobiales bacterium]
MCASPDRPNLLLIMSDEHAPQFAGFHGHPIVKTPHLDRLAAGGVVFDNAYCNSPICSPSRMSFMTGKYVHHIDLFDNSTALSSDEPTWAHRMRSVGYDVVLAGKQHFIGPDQLHGFRAQLARDLHSDIAHELYLWSDGITDAATPWKHMERAGPGSTPELDADDQAEEAALAYLRDPERRAQPWALTASFIAPHFPFIVPQEYWDMYPVDDIDLPRYVPGSVDDQHPVYQRMRRMFGLIDFPEDTVRRARAGYYALITWFDDKVGRLLAALDETGQRENTIVIYISDHGEMAGEYGMWRKSNFREHASRIPMVISWPGQLEGGRRITEVTSLIDLVPSMLELTGAPIDDTLDGHSFLPLLMGDLDGPWKNEAFCEYLAHGVARPMAMLRQGRFKLNFSLDDPVELFDLETDPDERLDLSSDPSYAVVREALRSRLLEHWDPISLEQRVRQSQQARRLIASALPPPAAYH